MNEARTPQHLSATFSSEGYSITPPALSRTLAPGQTLSVPLVLRPSAGARRGNAQLSLEAQLGARKIRSRTTFLVGEGGGTIPLAPAGFTMDGKADEWKKLGDKALLGTISEASQISQGAPSTWSGPQDAGARISAAWAPGALYVLVQVQDDKVIPAPAGAAPWDWDAIELFVDGRDAAFQYIKEPTAGVFQIGVSPGADGSAPNVQVLARSQLQGLQAATARTPDGYNVELKIPLSAANFAGGGFEAGRPLRMSVQLDDRDDPNAPRETVLGWSASPEGRNYEDTSGWKTLILGR